jgi:hypothetical protein
MYLYVELWKARSAWRELSQGERKSWMDKLLAGLQQQLQSGVEVVGFASNDGDTPLSSGFQYFAAWKMPNKEVAQQFEDFVERAGWHEYFEQVNARGQIMETEQFVSAHVNAGSR